MFGSVCSGIEAASVAWNPLGWKAAFFSEIEKFPCAVLSERHPSVPNYGDMTKFKEWPHADIDVLVGGTPCQSFSVAGLRKGLDDPRGNLTLTYLAVARKYRPRWLVWENVPGILSDRGGAFGAFLGGLAELGYGFAYRILDAQYFRVPQRRRRVFVVGYLGDWRAAAAVLFERHSLQGHPAPRRETGQRVAGIFTSRARSGGWCQDVDLAASEYMQPVARPLRAQAQASHRLDSDTYIPHTVGALTDGAHMGGGLTARTPTQGASLSSLSRCLNAGGQGRQDFETETLIPTNVGGFDVPEITRPLTAAMGTKWNGNGDLESSLIPAYAIQGAGRTSQGSQGSGINEEVSFTLNQTDQHAVAHALRGDGFDASEDGTGSAAGSIGYAEETAPTLGAADSGSNRTPAIMSAMQVRRLTPKECARLQGFPDDYLDIIYNGKPAKDGPKYKALGNSMAVPVMRWIGQRIAATSQLSLGKRAA